MTFISPLSSQFQSCFLLQEYKNRVKNEKENCGYAALFFQVVFCIFIEILRLDGLVLSILNKGIKATPKRMLTVFFFILFWQYRFYLYFNSNLLFGTINTSSRKRLFFFFRHLGDNRKTYLRLSQNKSRASSTLIWKVVTLWAY